MQVGKLLSPPAAPTTGANRESAISLFRRTCGVNQLSVRTVAVGLRIPGLYVVAPEYTSFASVGVSSIMAGDNLSRTFNFRMAEVSDLGELGNLTLEQFNRSKGVDRLVAKRTKAWCPACYQLDSQAKHGPYDRLLWSISILNVCPIHKLRLETRCRSCGHGPFRYLLPFDITGFCPVCAGWLGGSGTPVHSRDSQFAAYQLCVAKGFAALLRSGASQCEDVGMSVRTFALKVIRRRFDGAACNFGYSVGRSKAWTSDFLAGRRGVLWETICAVSFVFQIPLEKLISSEEIRLTDRFRELPPECAVLDRRVKRLERSVSREALSSICDELEKGIYPDLCSIPMVESFWKLPVPKVLRSNFPTEFARIAEHVAKRRKEISAERAAQRALLVKFVADLMAEQALSLNKMPSRRNFEKELAQRGVAMSRAFFNEDRQILRAALAQRLSR